MTIKDLIALYESKKKQYGADAHKHISNLLNEAKKIHKKDFFKGATAKKLLLKVGNLTTNSLGAPSKAKT